MWRIKQHEIFLVVVHNLEWETYDSYLRKYLISLQAMSSLRIAVAMPPPRARELH
jgi:hypothetical protein